MNHEFKRHEATEKYSHFQVSSMQSQSGFKTYMLLCQVQEAFILTSSITLDLHLNILLQGNGHEEVSIIYLGLLRMKSYKFRICSDLIHVSECKV